MRERVINVVSQGLHTITDSRIEVFQLPLAVTDAEVSQAAQIVPDILLRRTLLLPQAEQRPENIVIQLAGQLAVEIAQVQVFAVFRFSGRILSAQPQTIRQPQMRLGALRRYLNSLARSLDRLRIQVLEAVCLR